MSSRSRVKSGLSPALISIQGSLEHAQRRRLWQHAFTPESVKSYATKVADRALQLADVLKTNAEKSGSVNLTEWINYFTFDFMGDMAYAMLLYFIPAAF